MVNNKRRAIYILDNDQGWRSFAVAVLEKRGFHVEAFKHTESLPTSGSDLIVLGFPALNAKELDVIDQILDRKRSEPVVVFASTLSREGARSAFLRGASDVIRKTFDAAELIHAVNAQLGKQPARSRYATERMRRSNYD